jgi:hypothetical protein
VYERVTTDVRSALIDVPGRAVAAGRDRITVMDLAAALAVPRGNTAALWSTPSAPVDPSAATPRLDRQARTVLSTAGSIALARRAGHVGTEHVLAALVRTGPPDVVAWLADRGATAEAVEALLAELDGRLGAEQLAGEPTPDEQRRWRQLTGDGPTAKLSPAVTAVIVVAVVAVLFVLCVWGP